ncbi:putative ATP-grasp-modified RiPP [Amycolatopsis thermophila]|uniref:ATP-grasp target RiPP n=1 Tax=Amycolatopsis thermophila TaxID=206084 RepID=A0ABU0EMF6_9PSEU|nr:putative ATP-grasp-modified RiPP [Amycolatopsis thermophila]MDQ0376475.1 putative ATP-grasp target RiPP [Amycolatopsis thermophila]
MQLASTTEHERFTEDPMAGSSAQFPLSRGSFTTRDKPSEDDLRPWGLRRMSPVPASSTPASPGGTYDPVRQVRVYEGRPLIEMGPPTAITTGSQDGDEGDPSEDWHND